MRTVSPGFAVISASVRRSAAPSPASTVISAAAASVADETPMSRTSAMRERIEAIGISLFAGLGRSLR